MVELEFSPRLKPYMLQLNTLFTQYKLANILSMKSKYSPRIYEILKCNEFKKQVYIEIDINELRKLLRCDVIYPLYADFKRRVIEQTQKELKKMSDISFEFEEIKTGRTVTSLKFYIKSNNKSNSKKKDEVSVTLVEDQEEFNIETGTREVLKILQGHKVDSIDALKIYQNANSDIEYIKKVYEYSKTQNITTSLIGFMKTMVVPGVLKENIKTSKVDTFNNYDQRKYNYNDLERKLLGWDDNEKGEDTGKEYQQGRLTV